MQNLEARNESVDQENQLSFNLDGVTVDDMNKKSLEIDNKPPELVEAEIKADALLNKVVEWNVDISADDVSAFLKGEFNDGKGGKINGKQILIGKISWTFEGYSSKKTFLEKQATKDIFNEKNTRDLINLVSSINKSVSDEYKNEPFYKTLPDYMKAEITNFSYKKPEEYVAYYNKIVSLHYDKNKNNLESFKKLLEK